MTCRIERTIRRPRFSTYADVAVWSWGHNPKELKTPHSYLVIYAVYDTAAGHFPGRNSGGGRDHWRAGRHSFFDIAVDSGQQSSAYSGDGNRIVLKPSSMISGWNMAFCPTCTNIALSADDYGFDTNEIRCCLAHVVFCPHRSAHIQARGRAEFIAGWRTPVDGRWHERWPIPDATPAQPLAPQYRESYDGKGFASGSYFLDPWGNPYGYYYHEDGAEKSKHSPTSYDLWTTGGAKRNRSRKIGSCGSPTGRNSLVSRQRYGLPGRLKPSADRRRFC